MTTRAVTEILVEQHWEDSDLVLMARLKGADATNVTQATLSSVAVYVYNAMTQEQVGVTLAPSVASTVFDALQTDARWTEDSAGYNFRYTVPGTYFPSGETAYRIEVILTPASGSPFPLVVEVNTQSLFSS